MGAVHTMSHCDILRTGVNRLSDHEKENPVWSERGSYQMDTTGARRHWTCGARKAPPKGLCPGESAGGWGHNHGVRAVATGDLAHAK